MYVYHSKDTRFEREFLNLKTRTSLYRAIFKSDGSSAIPAGYHLSGIAHHILRTEQEEGVLRVPPNRNAGYIGQPSLSSKVIDVYPADFRTSRNYDKGLHGFTIHSRCWELIEHVFGPQVEKHLDLLVQALRLKWVGGAHELLSDTWYHYEYTRYRWDWTLQPIDIPSYLNDPMGTGETRSPCPSENHVYHSLPLEIKYLILDTLQREKDINGLLSGFEWYIPDSYWKGRFPREMGFEIGQIRWKEIDWPYIIENAKLITDSPSLQLRRRNVQFLRAVRVVFNRVLRA
ncbi:hypothetical protein ASPWEDRAFT_185713 [Aspergillus wentii DTO 134E9]|uniref:Uncharacterized protein n=1 Tax=Aspergillus wentii DTO 134E9 TaxID=1073089 RepID=A0A1L9REG8_ASPWE|nr:uncharacterized protein ASPWEDRAFT_185713 [Aspergillus wentii DTO 134E9]OJJ33312.1 hypothetical protein ASPWEDRAFT_185713 [Aspergillus wentii DTO 134E9]